MGRLDIIDSLVDNRVNEGMITTLSKNQRLEELQKALTRRDLKFMSNKFIRPSVEYFNNSPFKDTNAILHHMVVVTTLPSHNGKNYYIYHLDDKGTHYIMVLAYRNGATLKRCVIQRCDTADVEDTVWDYVDKKAIVIVDIMSEFNVVK